MGLCAHHCISGLRLVVHMAHPLCAIPHDWRDVTRADGLGCRHGGGARQGNGTQAATHILISGLCRQRGYPCGNRQSGGCGYGHRHRWPGGCVLDGAESPHGLGYGVRGVDAGAVVQAEAQGLVHRRSGLLYPAWSASAVDGGLVCGAHYLSVWLVEQFHSG